MLIVLIVVGILTTTLYQRYSSTVNRHSALDAATKVVALGLANKRNATDHKGRYVHRLRDQGSLFDCDEAECLPCNGPVCPSCNLLACKYVTKKSVESKNFIFNAVSPEYNGPACGIGQPEAPPYIIACASEGDIVKDEEGEGDPVFTIKYTGWAYTYHTDGVVLAHFGAPDPVIQNDGRKGASIKDYDLVDNK